MTHYFLAANAWLAAGLALVIGEWGYGRSCNLFGYGRIEPALYWACAAAALAASGFCLHRWLRAADDPPAPFFALANAWLIAALALVLGMQSQDSTTTYQLFGKGRIEAAAYWGALVGVCAAAGFCLLCWGRGRSAQGSAAGGPTAGRDLARVGLLVLVAVTGYAGWLVADDPPRRFPDDYAVVAATGLGLLAAFVFLCRKAFGPARQGPAPHRVAGVRGLSGGMTTGLVLLGAAAVGLTVLTAFGAAVGFADGLLVWYVCLLAIGFLGAGVLLVAVLTYRTGSRGRRGGRAVPGHPTDATPALFRVAGGLGLGGLFVIALLPLLGPIAHAPPAVWVAVAVVFGGAVVLVLSSTRSRPRPAHNHLDPAWGRYPRPSDPECPKCRGPIPPGAPAGLCPRCLLEAAAPRAGGPIPTLAFVESYTPPDVESVRRLFPYLEVVQLIGQGGMGAVYLARQPALDRPVALKLVRRRADDPTFAERFAREARAMARLGHPNVVAVHESGEAGGLPYLVMEYVPGTTLREAMRAKSLAPAAALVVARQVCDALEYAHRHGVVHRDIKPENILLQFDEAEGATDTDAPRTGLPRVKIADFGLAKVAEAEGVSLTGTRQAMGTPHYMAPEQWERPGEVDHRADIYALGVVLYELLTGELPLGRFDPPSRKIEVDVRVDEVVLRALAKEPGRRYQHAREVRTDLDHIGPEAGR